MKVIQLKTYFFTNHNRPDDVETYFTDVLVGDLFISVTHSLVCVCTWTLEKLII